MHFTSSWETLYAHIYDTFMNDTCIDIMMTRICIFEINLILPCILHVPFSKASLSIYILKHAQHQIPSSAVQKMKSLGQHANWSGTMILEG